MRTLDIIITHIVSQLSFKYIHLSDYLHSFACSPDLDMTFQLWKDHVSKPENKGSPWYEPWQFYLSGSKEILLKELEIIWDFLRSGGGILCINDPRYPYLLKQIKDPPIILFYRGNPLLFEFPAISLVGSRKAAPEALRESRDLGKALVEEGAVVVSGGALGCDTYAHLGALSVEGLGATIVVMAGAVDSLFPKRNRQLFSSVLERGGLIISERLPRTSPKPHDFPIRNRIISGLSSRSIIMQAAERSGAMATANLALAQGRDVWVYDCGHSDVRFKGNDILIESGAPSFTASKEYFSL